MRVRLLGPVRAWQDHREVVLGPPRQRAVFAALAVRAGRVVSRSELVAAVWGAAALVFERLCRQARAAEPAAAVEIYDRALGLWAGEALAGVPGPGAEAERVRLGELQLSTVEDGPAQLPQDVPGFTGRGAELAALAAALTEARDRAVVVVEGAGGVGKTALAVHAGGRERHRFPDGQLYVDLRGFDPRAAPMSVADALGRLLRGLGAEPDQLAAELPGQLHLYRAMCADRRLLVVLDNAVSAEQIAPLLPGSPGSAVLVTSRNRLSELPGRGGCVWTCCPRTSRWTCCAR